MKYLSHLCLLGIVIALTSCKEPMAQWRGEDRNGIFKESGLLDEWPEEGPELLWVYEGLGRGYAAPAVNSKGVYINGEEDGKSFTLALDLEGNELWKSQNGEEFLGDGFSATYPGARSTPTLVDGKVYASSGSGNLSSYNASNGKLNWSVSLIEDLGGILGYFGYSESPAVVGDLLYCFPGGHSTNLAALDRHTGEVAWTAALKKDTFAYGSILPVELPEANVLLGTSRYYIYAVDQQSGELLSTYDLEGYEYDGEHCNTLVYEDGFIYFVANDIPGQGSVKLKISDDGRRIEEMWRNPEVLNNFGGFVVLDGSIITTLRGNKMVNLDPENGSIIDSLKSATGGIAFADDKIFIYGYSGEVQMYTYNGRYAEKTGSVRVKEGSGHHFAHPVIADGVLYIRRGDALLAYKVK